jgi:hypothetical protein
VWRQWLCAGYVIYRTGAVLTDISIVHSFTSDRSGEWDSFRWHLQRKDPSGEETRKWTSAHSNTHSNIKIITSIHRLFSYRSRYSEVQTYQRQWIYLTCNQMFSEVKIFNCVIKTVNPAYTFTHFKLCIYVYNKLLLIRFNEAIENPKRQKEMTII